MLLSGCLFGAAAILGLLCAVRRQEHLLLSLLIVCLVCAGIVTALMEDLPMDRIASGTMMVVLCLLLPCKGGDAA